LVFRQTITPAYLIAAESGVVIVALALFTGLFWNNLLELFQRLQRARLNRAVSGSAPPPA